ncbi:hypothetical protein Tco_1145411, partial [Tanacetum coccineum]
ESSSRNSSESRRKTHYNLRRILASEEKNQDQDDGVRADLNSGIIFTKLSDNTDVTGKVNNRSLAELAEPAEPSTLKVNQSAKPQASKPQVNKPHDLNPLNSHNSLNQLKGIRSVDNGEVVDGISCIREQMHSLMLLAKHKHVVELVPRSKDNRNWNQGSSSKAVRIEDASEKAMCAIDGGGFDWSDMAEDEIQANMALMAFTDSEVSIDKSCSKSCLQNYEALKKQYNDLLVKLDDTAFKAATYKRGLSILEAQVVKYKESEVLKVNEERRGECEFKLAKFEKSSKDLDDLLASQVLEEYKQPEINWYGPRDSSSKPTTVCDRESNNSKENTDDPLTQQPKSVTETSSVVPTLKVDKKWKEKFFNHANNDRLEEPKSLDEKRCPIIEDWCQIDDEEDESTPKVTKDLGGTKEVNAVLMKTGLKTVKNAKPLSTDKSVNTARPVYQDCIGMPIWKDASYFDDTSLKSVGDAQIQDQDGTHDDCSFQDNGFNDQQVNTASPQVNTGSREVSTAVPEVNTATSEGLMGPIPTTEDT